MKLRARTLEPGYLSWSLQADCLWNLDKLLNPCMLHFPFSTYLIRWL